MCSTYQHILNKLLVWHYIMTPELCFCCRHYTGSHFRLSLLFLILLSWALSEVMWLDCNSNVWYGMLLDVECGGKMHLREAEYEKAHTDFFEVCNVQCVV